MRLELILLICLLVWAITNFLALPWVAKRWKASGRVQRASQAAMLALAKRVRDLALVGAITIICIVVLVLFLQDFFTDWSTASREAIVWLSSLHSVVEEWSNGYALAVALITTAGCIVGLYITWRHAARKVAAAWAEEATRVMTEAEEDDALLEREAQSERSQHLKANLRKERALLEEILRMTSNRETPDVLRQREVVIATEWQLALDIARRRAPIEAILSSADAFVSPGKGWRAKIVHMIATERFAKDVASLERPFSLAVSALLVVSMIGWAGPPMASSLEVTLDQLRIEQSASRGHSTPVSEPLEDDEPVPPELEHVEENKDVEVATEMLARHVIHQLLRTGIIVVQNGKAAMIVSVESAPRASPAPSKAEWAQLIVDIHHRSGGVASIRPVGGAEPEVVDGPTTSIGDDPPLQNDVKDQVRPMIRETHDKSPQAVRKYIDKFNKRYGKPLSPLVASQRASVAVWESIVHLPPLAPGDPVLAEVDSTSRKAIHEAGGKLFESTVRYYATEAIAAAAGGDIAGKKAPLFIEIPAETKTLSVRAELPPTEMANATAHRPSNPNPRAGRLPPVRPRLSGGVLGFLASLPLAMVESSPSGQSAGAPGTCIRLSRRAPPCPAASADPEAEPAHASKVRADKRRPSPQ